MHSCYSTCTRTCRLTYLDMTDELPVPVGLDAVDAVDGPGGESSSVGFNSSAASFKRLFALLILSAMMMMLCFI